MFTNLNLHITPASIRESEETIIRFEDLLNFDSNNIAFIYTLLEEYLPKFRKNAKNVSVASENFACLVFGGVTSNLTQEGKKKKCIFGDYKIDNELVSHKTSGQKNNSVGVLNGSTLKYNINVQSAFGIMNADQRVKDCRWINKEIDKLKRQNYKVDEKKHELIDIIREKTGYRPSQNHFSISTTFYKKDTNQLIFEKTHAVTSLRLLDLTIRMIKLYGCSDEKYRISKSSTLLDRFGGIKNRVIFDLNLTDNIKSKLKNFKKELKNPTGSGQELPY
jgi:hypothetical protein